MNLDDLRTRIIAGLLFISHTLMSCSGLVNTDKETLKEQLIAQPTDDLLYEKAATDQENRLIAPRSLAQEDRYTRSQQEDFITRELVGKTFEPQVGQEVTFYKEGGILKARTPISSGLDVYMGEVNLSQRLPARHIHIVTREQDKNKRGYVYIDQGGLSGGMMESDQDNYLSNVPNECFWALLQIGFLELLVKFFSPLNAKITLSSLKKLALFSICNRADITKAITIEKGKQLFVALPPKQR